MRLLLATTNQGKIKELNKILGDEGFALEGLGKQAAEVEESGATFAENALLKARYHHQRTGLVTIADDSGLEVEALNGQPGIYSARYAGAGASDLDRINKLLQEIKEVPDAQRAARFVCVAALVWQGGERVFVGEVRGQLLRATRGDNGFGYDPIFYFAPLGKSFAELSDAEKTAISHRGVAFRQLAQWLKEHWQEVEERYRRYAGKDCADD
ncbi:MAG: RdgB/HAM1 family non-canonical purine NTP pyrophosphatase [Acidobacteria bacterium]|nr:RdgB/HAM1 family non-canonical purine NTP pyrophosphatase [Acidobacteriota bacterium]